MIKIQHMRVMMHSLLTIMRACATLIITHAIKTYPAKQTTSESMSNFPRETTQQLQKRIGKLRETFPFLYPVQHIKTGQIYIIELVSLSPGDLEGLVTYCSYEEPRIYFTRTATDFMDKFARPRGENWPEQSPSPALQPSDLSSTTAETEKDTMS